MTEIIKRPLLPGMARFELLHQDKDGNILDYKVNDGPAVFMRAGHLADAPVIPFLGPAGNILITIPTVGHNKMGAIVGALTGWTMAIGIGTAAEAAADTALSSQITTYGGEVATVTPTILNAVVTWSHKWTFTTGASFAVIEAGVFKDTVLMLRHKYSTATDVVATDSITATLTDTF